MSRLSNTIAAGLGILAAGSLGYALFSDDGDLAWVIGILSGLGAGAACIYGRGREREQVVPQAEPRVREPRAEEIVYEPSEVEPTEQEQTEETEPEEVIVTPPPGQEQEEIPTFEGELVEEPEYELDLIPPYVKQFIFFDNFEQLADTLNARMRRMDQARKIKYEKEKDKISYDMQEILHIYKGDIEGDILDILGTLRENYNIFWRQTVRVDQLPPGRDRFLNRLGRSIENVDSAYREAAKALELIQDKPGKRFRQLGQYVFETHELLREAIRRSINHLTIHGYHKFNEDTNSYVIDESSGELAINCSYGDFEETTIETIGLYIQAVERMTGEEGSICAYVKNQARELGMEFDYEPNEWKSLRNMVTNERITF
jgi:hypothetical protein